MIVASTYFSSDEIKSPKTRESKSSFKEEENNKGTVMFVFLCCFLRT